MNDFDNELKCQMTLQLEEWVAPETISTSDQNYDRPFLRNEFPKIFEDLFSMIISNKNIKIKAKDPRLALGDFRICWL